MTEQIHKLAQKGLPRAAHLGEGLVSDDGAPGEDDSMLFDMPSVRDEEDGGEAETEAIDAPERHEQLSLISKVGKDIDEFDDHITQNEFHLKHAREQLDGFRKFVQQADVRLDEIHRLRKRESQLLKQFAAEESKSQELQRALDVEKANSAATKSRIAEYRSLLETARGEILSLAEHDRKLRKQLEEYSLASNKREAKLLEVTRNSERIAAENKVLQENYERTHFEMVKYRKSVTELQKTLDELVANGSQEREENDRLTATLASATEALEKYQAENIELRSELDKLVSETAANEKRASAKIRIREEELFSLRSQVEGLQSELRVKNQMMTQAIEEARSARGELQVSATATQGFNDQLAHAAKQNEEQREQLMEANAEIAEVNKRFKALIGELEESRRENLQLKRILKAERQKFELFMNESPEAEVDTPEKQLLADMPDAGDSKKLN